MILIIILMNVRFCYLFFQLRVVTYSFIFGLTLPTIAFLSGLIRSVWSIQRWICCPRFIPTHLRSSYRLVFTNYQRLRSSKNLRWVFISCSNSFEWPTSQLSRCFFFLLSSIFTLLAMYFCTVFTWRTRYHVPSAGAFFFITMTSIHCAAGILPQDDLWRFSPTCTKTVAFIVYNSLIMPSMISASLCFFFSCGQRIEFAQRKTLPALWWFLTAISAFQDFLFFFGFSKCSCLSL